MNLDKLQDEVGVDAREPLPKPPPLRSTPTKALAAEAAEPAPAAPAPLAEATEVARQRAEQLLAQSGDFFASAGEKMKQAGEKIKEDTRKNLGLAADLSGGFPARPRPPRRPPRRRRPRRPRSPGARRRDARRSQRRRPRRPGRRRWRRRGAQAADARAAAPTPAAPKPAAPKPAAPKPAAPRPERKARARSQAPQARGAKPAAPKPAESRLAAAFKSTTSALAGAPRGSSARERAWEAEAAGRVADARLEAEVVELRAARARRGGAPAAGFDLVDEAASGFALIPFAVRKAGGPVIRNHGASAE
ncbi:hypothetical protein JL722_3796 [Aureococcus anophagefferens]|nr:hypothetical protein JL722_3796 [Aureococcus anophagefferens]